MAAKTLLVNKGAPTYGFHLAIDAAGGELYRWLTSTDDFRELRIYVRGFADYLAVLKGYDSDGKSVICFASGTDAISCLLAAEGVLGEGKWREDKPIGK